MAIEIPITIVIDVAEADLKVKVRGRRTALNLGKVANPNLPPNS